MSLVEFPARVHAGKAGANEETERYDDRPYENRRAVAPSRSLPTGWFHFVADNSGAEDQAVPNGTQVLHKVADFCFALGQRAHSGYPDVPRGAASRGIDRAI